MPLKTQRDEQPTLNLTPMIDVVFLLIIFFMVASKFTELERNIDLEVPQVAAAGNQGTPPTPRTVNVFQDGHIELDGQTVTIDQLTTQLAAARSSDDDLAVVIRGDGGCEFQHIASALAACREAGVAELGITVRVAGQSPAARRVR